MSNSKFLLLSFLLALSTNTLFAHALWIETPSSGKLKQKQIVKIYYGEYADQERDSITKWYSDVRDLTLWLIGPDQQKTQLTLTPGIDYLESSFIPVLDGAYLLEVSHEAKELGGTTKYHFLASAGTTVGKALPIQVKSTNALKLHRDDLRLAKVNQPVKLQAVLHDTAVKIKTVSVFSPVGWSKEIKTDEQGNASFTPLWPGTYVIEISNMDKTPGTHHGKEYTGTWKGATYSIQVSK